MKLIYIKWCDAIGRFESWNTKSEALEWGANDYWHVESVGWVMKETKKYIVLCSKIGLAQSEEPMYGQLFKLPKTWIIERKELSGVADGEGEKK